MLVDTHAHIYLNRFDSDRDEMIGRARESSIANIIMPAIDVASVHLALELCDRYAGLYAMAALHPSDTKEATDADMQAIVDLCEDPRVVAVGESGLDYFWDRSFDVKQQDYFRRHIRLAIEKDLPLIMHLRDKQNRQDCHRDVVRILQEEKAVSDHPEFLRGIFHCFGGPGWLAEEAADLGFLVGIGGTLTFKNSGVAELVENIPLQHIVLETDAPFLAPVPHRGKRNEPAYVRFVAEKLSEVKGIPLEEVVRITTENARRVFGIDCEKDT